MYGVVRERKKGGCGGDKSADHCSIVLGTTSDGIRSDNRIVGIFASFAGLDGVDSYTLPVRRA